MQRWVAAIVGSAAVVVVVVACKGREADPGPMPEWGRAGSGSGTGTDAQDAVDACDPSAGTFCDGDAVVECTRDGQRGRTVMTCRAGCRRGACVETCAAKDVELVYVVDDANNLLSFDPRKLPGDPFVHVGTLDCATSASPFSMAVDNRGVAWVLYDDGTLFRASIHDARCARSGHRLEGAPSAFGMGFAADGPKSPSETLYVADDQAEDGNGKLASIDTSGDVPRYHEIGTLRAGQKENPELTGTADGKLYGYFPDPKRGFVVEIDRKTARATGPRRQLPALGGEIGAYAFAHWGGTFYIFQSEDTKNTVVHAIDRKTGRYRRVLDKTEHRIVGAGVSTCAPLLERAP